MIISGTAVYTLGSILVAAATTVRSFNFMIGGRVILALGDIATQIAQYKMFSSWFPPSRGFASTLGFELAIGKVRRSHGIIEDQELICIRLVASLANRQQMSSPR